MTGPADGWLIENGIGEDRAARVVGGQLVAARVERHGGGPRVDDVIDVTLVQTSAPGHPAICADDEGRELAVNTPAAGITEGQAFRVVVTRPALTEPGGTRKRAMAKPAPPGSSLRRTRSLCDELAAGAAPVTLVGAHDADRLAEIGWHEAVEQAQTGRVRFDGGELLIALTPAMTVIDVDGATEPVALATRAADEVADALVRLDIGGSVAIDFPTLERKADRAAVASAFDDRMTEPCERTSLNGFGLMQVVRRFARPSLPAVLQTSPLRTTALSLLRQAERLGGAGVTRIEAHPGVARQLRPDWLDELRQRTGRDVQVTESGSIPVHAGNVTVGAPTP